MEVNISETPNASQMPVVPHIRGNNINDGTRKTNPLSSAKTIDGMTFSTL